ncbi:nucleotidyltransferase domain-containing protein [Halomonas llamarensis]|uniref:Nucleotidyltransferase domain-containing protein n=1 Tax=Halomonas llamarensis TaxID=2945104 RepID=A0ABT0SVU2_9GAMM|nr:nucleotidyltransferase domain-containing protein [Halomonas llamarensis]MCL7931565.1 nucleotidyltransferase domain-containing protein [Halomonas llamarensis]
MRLTPEQVAVIEYTLRHYFGKQSEICVFGSRVDDHARGGDIDLYIEPEKTGAAEVFDAKIEALVALKQVLGDQRIDLVINRGCGEMLPIYTHAKATGIKI